MSRRRLTSREELPHPEGEHRLSIVCTDAGQHRTPVRIARAFYNPTSPEPAHVLRVEFSYTGDEPDSSFRVDTLTGTPHITHRFPCRKCGRDKPVRDENLLAQVRTAVAEGRTGLDISRF